jgi:hypothetical protein
MANFISLTALKVVAVSRHPLPKYFHLLSEMDSLAREGLWIKTVRCVSDPAVCTPFAPGLLFGFMKVLFCWRGCLFDNVFHRCLFCNARKHVYTGNCWGGGGP